MKKQNYLTLLLFFVLFTACSDTSKISDDLGSGTVDFGNKTPKIFLNADYYGKWSYVDSLETINIISTTELNATIIENDANLLQVNTDGMVRYLVRSGIATTVVEGKIEVDSSQGASNSSPRRAYSYKGIGNIKIILSNVIDTHIREITKTKNDGTFITTTLPTGFYNLEASDETLELKTVVEIKNKENNIGVYKLTGENLHNFKAELILNEEYVVSDSKAHEAVLRVHNISDKIGFGLSYDISLNDTTNDNGFIEGSAASVGSVQAKGYKDIPISLSFSKLASNSKEYGIDVVIKDALGNQWIDTFTFTVHKELVAILIETDKAAVRGYLKNPLTGEMKSIDTASGNILVPLMPEDTPYILILSNPSFANETKYSIAINALPEDLSTFKDTAAQEPNNNQSEATSLRINETVSSYLHGTDIDYWKIYTQEGVSIDTGITNDFANNEVAPSIAPILIASDNEFEDKIVVSWNSINSATYYVLEESLVEEGPYTQIQSSLIDTSLNITTASVNTLYFYKVQACNTQGCSPFSTSNSGTLLVPNNKPVANAGVAISVQEGETVTLDASLSSDSDGSINGYEWFLDGSIDSFSSKKIENSTVFNVGEYVITLVVTDDKGATGSTTVSVSVTAAPNVSPVANAGIDQAVTVGNGVTLSAENSSDSDGTIDSYLWEVTGSNDVQLETFTTTSLSVGPHTFNLTVIDDDGATSTDSVIITVLSAPNATPTVDAGSNQIITKGDTLSQSAVAADTDGSISSFIWQEDGNTLGELNPLSINSLATGVHTITVTVTDNDGAIASDTFSVTVNAPVNQAPIADAGIDRTIQAGESIVLNASGSSDDTSIVDYSWKEILTEGSNLLGSLESITLSNLSVGVHTIKLYVFDAQDALDTDTITIIVNNPPVAIAGNDATILLGESITFDASLSSDSDGNIVSYRWFDNNGLFDVSTSSTTQTFSTAGTYIVSLEVRDNDGKTSTATQTITVLPMTFVTAKLIATESFQIAGRLVVKDSVGTVRYSIDSGVNSDKFSIDSITGIISFVETLPKVDTSISYYITVSASDNFTTITKTNFEIKFNSLYKNATYYSFIKSATTNRIWLDKNLGAVECLEDGSNTPECYGLYYQWGRYNSGYEKYNSQTSTVKLNDQLDADYKYKNEYSTKFILSNSPSGSSEHDWQVVKGDSHYGVAREEILKTVNHKHQMCPNGYRLPSPNEIKAEHIEMNRVFFGILNGTGYRSEETGRYYKSPEIYLWTYSRYYLSGTGPSRYSSIAYSSLSDGLIDMKRSRGYQVRCIQN